MRLKDKRLAKVFHTVDNGADISEVWERMNKKEAMPSLKHVKAAYHQHRAALGVAAAAASAHRASATPRSAKSTASSSRTVSTASTARTTAATAKKTRQTSHQVAVQKGNQQAWRSAYKR